MAEKLVHNLFPKKSKIELISESIVWSFIQFAFIVCQVKGYRNWNQDADHLLSPHIKLSKKQKEAWSYSPCLILCVIFYIKHFPSYSINWPNFIVWLPLFCEILGNMYCNFLLARLQRPKNFEINLISNYGSNQAVLLSDEKVKTKI